MVERIFEEAIDAIEKGDAEKAVELAKRGLAEGINGIDLINKGFIPGITKVGDLFGEGRLFIPELIMSATAMQEVTDIINASLTTQEFRVKGRIVLGTVEGDLHDIGKTIVVSLFKANGFEVMDLGRDVPVELFIEKAEEFDAHIIGTSALLTTTMSVQKELEEKLKESGLKKRYKTMVGGAPVTQRWANRIGADAYAEDASDGVKKIKELMAGL
jgi:trimethylamine corrinoid protein